MAQISTSLMTDIAKQRFQSLSLPAGVDRNKHVTYINAICSAIGRAWNMWQSQASLTQVSINGPIATGGKLSGPGLEPIILSMAPPGWENYSRPIAAGIHNQWRSFQQEVRVPGLPWYPAFAAFPAPVAPPMPNLPCPLSALSAQALRFMKEADLATAIINKFGNPKPPCANEVAKVVAAGVEKALVPWLSGAMITLVMGGGRVPAFAPPYVPVGQVIGGTGNMQPGGLA
jgi:hypothetical protein